MFFQNEGVVIHRAQEKVEATYKDILSCIMNRSSIKNIPAEKLSPFDIQFFLKPAEFDFGPQLSINLQASNIDKRAFLVNCFNFVVAIAFEIRER